MSEELSITQKAAAWPTQVKDYVLGRLWEILNGRDLSPDFAHLTPSDRQAIREILVDTKLDLPVYWRDVDRAAARK